LSIRFTARHTQDTVKHLFERIGGYLQADASSVYDALFRAHNGSTEVGCLAHAWRKFFEAVREERPAAQVALALFEGIFRAEREASKGPPGQRLVHRRARAGPLWEQLCAWCETQADMRDGERKAPSAICSVIARRSGAFWTTHASL
jgi:transposase